MTCRACPRTLTRPAATDGYTGAAGLQGVSLPSPLSPDLSLQVQVSNLSPRKERGEGVQEMITGALTFIPSTRGSNLGLLRLRPTDCVYTAIGPCNSTLKIIHCWGVGRERSRREMKTPASPQ